MNKKMLLAGAAVFALTVASTANAAGVNLKTAAGSDATAAIHPTVDLVGTFTLSNAGDLKFGVVVNPVAGQTITVSDQGNVSGTGNVNLLGEGALTATAKARTTQTVQAGSFTVTGALDTLVARTGTGGDVESVVIDMPDSAIDLYIDGDTNKKCGTITAIPDISIVTGQTTYTYGGTLTLAQGVADLSGHCQPSSDPVVTLVMTPVAIAAPAPANP